MKIRTSLSFGSLGFRGLAYCVAMSASVAAIDATAAGGHFDVDDATVLDHGHCQYETWITRAPSADATAFHLGPGCRVGPVEMAVNVDRFVDRYGQQNLVGPQLKWVADPWIKKLSIGVAWNASFDVNHGGTAQTLYVPVTWWVADRLWMHVNAGVDRSTSGDWTHRAGASLEWAVNDKLTVIGEHASFIGEHVTRVGARFNLNKAISVDISAARRSASGSPLYVIGLNQDFTR